MVLPVVVVVVIVVVVVVVFRGGLVQLVALTRWSWG